MSLVQLTARLYADSLRHAARAWVRTAWAVAVLVGSWVAMMVAGLLLAPLGIVGGLLMFLLSCLLTGAYLSMVEVGVLGQRVLRPGDLSSHLGQHWQIVASVGFVFWIPSMLLAYALPPLTYAAAVGLASVVFNPVPEMVYQDRHEGGLAILGDAVDFMQRNWPEWLVALAGVTAPYLGLWALLQGGWSLGIGLLALETFGPFFGFVEGGAGLVMVGPMAASSLVLAPLVHFVMLFRGQVYKRLRRSNRRQRAWQSRF